MEFLYGFNAVYAALSVNSGRALKRLLVFRSPRSNPKLKRSEAQVRQDVIMELAQSKHLTIQFASKEELSRFCPGRPHQNVILETSKIEVLKCDAGVSNGKNLMLFDVCDPQNLGSILRSALLFNIERVYLAGSCSMLSPIVAKASAGALEVLTSERKLSFVRDLRQFFGSTTVPKIASVCREKEPSPFRPQSEGLLVVGNEGDGLPRSVISQCSSTITLNSLSNEFVDSFNVSVATALLISKLFS
jgi:tRNA G18 (ribose-2'-O)-methylase SpoU